MDPTSPYDLEERLLEIMDKKDHWAWAHFTRPGLTKDQLAIHFRHEFLTYVRDFPVLLARVLGQGPPQDAREALARNIDEEQTGHYSFGVSHPELFLQMMDGLGVDRASVLEGPLEPEALAYREQLDRYSASPPWFIGAAVVTIFVEGSVHERQERHGTRQALPIEEAIARHPIVRFHGCPPAAMRLARAHRAVEGDHRRDAWSVVFRHVPAAEGARASVVAAVGDAHRGWLRYRDGVARAMGLQRA
ncbi:MAG TPA: iron-containing redox enzyme family protein [Polyangiaceae bacterium]|nr:iron-containing redox enzyme family protein [Polyangiaceae bacterium]